ncbi:MULTISPECIES: hypothetical protein [Roseomonadaceae]|uniref:Prepilin type IV endopeptidase peptidase domain-containing protein n=1 Tax=Falsiroseomonas oleicola TaxID=2801474 RepID=A0ABS6H481_9PROT|nr:hypothetical protein [Roseomonas oleicola]MBU8543481.1 hypothetical protein [Roseomonas oleicola]
MMAQAMPGLLALLVAGALALAGRRWRGAAMLALGAGVLAGWWWLFGALPASPRQLPERLPLLALAMLVLVGLGMVWRLAPAWLLPGLGVLGTGWWMAGAPRNLADLAQAAPVVVAVALYALPALRATRGAAVLAAGLLWAGLALAGPPGPAALLALGLWGASLGAAAAPPGTRLASLPFAAALAALAALPVLARGAAVDGAVALLPLAALLLWPRILTLRHRRR